LIGKRFSGSNGAVLYREEYFLLVSFSRARGKPDNQYLSGWKDNWRGGECGKKAGTVPAAGGERNRELPEQRAHFLKLTLIRNLPRSTYLNNKKL